MIGIAFIFGITLLFFGITASIAIWACNVYWLYTVYAALSALLMMFWLAIDVQVQIIYQNDYYLAKHGFSHPFLMGIINSTVNGI